MKKILSLFTVLLLSISGLGLAVFAQNHTIDENTLFEVQILNGESEVIMFQDQEEVDNFILNSNEPDEIVELIATRFNTTSDEIQDLVTIQDILQENTTISVILMENSSNVVVQVNGEEVDNFTLNTIVSEEIIEQVAQRLNVSEQDVLSVINIEEEVQVDISQILVTIEDNNALVEVEVDNETDSFTLNLTEESAIITELAERYSVPESVIESVIDFEEEVQVDISQILVTVRDNDALVEVEVDGETDSFTLNLTEESAIITELAERYSVSESVIESVIDFEDEFVPNPDMIQVTMSLEEFDLYRIFVNFLNIFESVDDNVGNNEFDNNAIVDEDSMIRRINIVAIDAEEITLEVKRSDWFMFKFLRSYIDISNNDVNPEDNLVY